MCTLYTLYVHNIHKVRQTRFDVLYICILYRLAVCIIILCMVMQANIFHITFRPDVHRAAYICILCSLRNPNYSDIRRPTLASNYFFPSEQIRREIRLKVHHDNDNLMLYCSSWYQYNSTTIIKRKLNNDNDKIFKNIMILTKCGFILTMLG